MRVIVAGVVSRPVSPARVPTSASAAGGAVSNALIRATRLHANRARQLLQAVGLHPGQELLLMHLWDVGPQRQADLAVEFGTDSASMTRTVQRLERTGLVRRRRDARDGRVTLVESTPVGLALRAQIESIWAELEKDTIGALSASQQRQLIRSLNLLEANLAEASGDDA